MTNLRLIDGEIIAVPTGGDKARRAAILDTAKSILIGGDGAAEAVGEAITHASVIASRHGSLTDARRVISDLAWFDRSIGNRIRPATSYVRLGAAGTYPLAVAAAQQFHAQRLRFDFRFGTILDHFDRPDVDDDVLASIVLFAKLGLHQATGEDVNEFILAHPELDVVCLDIILQGLWLASHLPASDQANRILTLSDKLIEWGDHGPNVRYRRAHAHRLLGKYEEARDELHAAIELLDSNDLHVHTEYVRELRSIDLSEEFDRKLAAAAKK